MAFRWLGVARHGFLLPFLSGEVARRFFFLRCLSQTMFTTRAFHVLRWYPTPTAVFILPMLLLLLALCSDRTTHDLGLGLLSYIQRTGTAATTAAATARGATATTIKELRSELPRRFWLYIVSAVEGEDTRLHQHTKISSDDAMSRTKQSWSCSHQRVRAGIAHGPRMVRLHVGEYHVSALIFSFMLLIVSKMKDTESSASHDRAGGGIGSRAWR